MAFSAGVPMLLILAVALGKAPAPHAALVYSVLFAFFGTFGSAIPWARDAERGWIHRLALTGIGMPALTVQRLLTGALIDAIELLPSVIVIGVLYQTAAPDLVRLFLALVASLLFANALGALVASIAASLAETALLSSVTALLLLHAAGVFRTPAPGGFADALQRIVPFHYLHRAIVAALGAR